MVVHMLKKRVGVLQSEIIARLPGLKYVKTLAEWWSKEKHRHKRWSKVILLLVLLIHHKWWSLDLLAIGRPNESRNTPIQFWILFGLMGHRNIAQWSKQNHSIPTKHGVFPYFSDGMGTNGKACCADVRMFHVCPPYFVPLGKEFMETGTRSLCFRLKCLFDPLSPFQIPPIQRNNNNLTELL